MIHDFPLVGRDRELSELRALLEQARSGRGGTVFVTGGAGIGKSRLALEILAEARDDGWLGALGRAFPVESAGPYAIFADALGAVIGGMDGAALRVLTRGSEEELAPIFPFLAPADPRVRVDLDPSESKTRLLWNFAQFLVRLSERQPLLLVLEDLQWVDGSSAELLHFVSRQMGDAAIACVCVHNEAATPVAGTLADARQSLVTLGAAHALTLEPLSLAATTRLVSLKFSVGEKVIQDFARRLHDWTGGNPYFLIEALKSLVDSGQLRRKDDSWIGWSSTTLQLPSSVRDSIDARVARLDGAARAVADVSAVLGTRVSHDLLEAVAGLEREDTVGAVEGLLAAGFMQEVPDSDAIAYEFVHPVLRDSLYSSLSRARAQQLHARLGRALEELHRDDPAAHADELAYHYARAGATGEEAVRAVRYLALAGRNALARQANEEAVRLLTTALEALEAQGGDPAVDRLGIVADLARARQRGGDHEVAAALWSEVRESAREAGDGDGVAAAERRLGLLHYWRGGRSRALRHFRAGLEASGSTGDPALRARLLLVEGLCLMEIGEAEPAREALDQAWNVARELGIDALKAQIRQAMIILFTWTGPPDAAREHGAAAASLAEASGSPELLWSVHWALAVLEGLTGHGNATARKLAVCESIPEAMRSPLRRLWTSEIALELAWATGEWDDALSLGESAVAMARTLGQESLLPRLLVLTASVQLGRGNEEEGRALVDEAWRIAVDEDAGGGRQVAAVVPAYTGRAAYHMVTGDWDQAIEVGVEGLAIADRYGYVAWGIHRLLPVIVESYLHRRDLDEARRYAERLRTDSLRMGHRLGLAWTSACNALDAWLTGDVARSAGLMEAAATALEEVPYVPDAARLRRQLAGRLAELGDREGALEQLRKVHDVFERLGAEPELRKTRQMFGEVGSRPPPLKSSDGLGGLSGREFEVARLVARRMSNKAIAKSLGISHRTVSTHLSNIFQKVGVTSRGELTDLIREMDPEGG